MTSADVVSHALAWGLLLSAYLAVAFVGLLRLDAEMWLDDYPPDVRRAFGSMSDRARRLRFRLGGPVLAGALAVVAYATLDFTGTGAYGGGPAALAIHTFVLLMTFNVVDLFLIDWILFVRIQPDWVVLEGTDGLPGYSSYRFHFRGFLKGTAGILVASVAVGSLVLVT